MSISNRVVYNLMAEENNLARWDLRCLQILYLCNIAINNYTTELISYGLNLPFALSSYQSHININESVGLSRPH